MTSGDAWVLGLPIAATVGGLVLAALGGFAPRRITVRDSHAPPPREPQGKQRQAVGPEAGPMAAQVADEDVAVTAARENGLPMVLRVVLALAITCFSLWGLFIDKSAAPGTREFCSAALGTVLASVLGGTG